LLIHAEGIEPEIGNWLELWGGFGYSQVQEKLRFYHGTGMPPGGVTLVARR